MTNCIFGKCCQKNQEYLTQYTFYFLNKTNCLLYFKLISAVSNRNLASDKARFLKSWLQVPEENKFIINKSVLLIDLIVKETFVRFIDYINWRDNFFDHCLLRLFNYQMFCTNYDSYINSSIMLILLQTNILVSLLLKLFKFTLN